MSYALSADPDAQGAPLRLPAAAITGMALVALSASLGSAILPMLHSQLALPSSAVGWLLTAQLVGLVLGLLPMASLVPLAGPRGAFRIGLLAVLGLALLASLPLGYWPMLALRFLLGAATALLLPASLSLLRLSVPAARIGLAVGAAGLAVTLALYLPSLAWIALSWIALGPLQPPAIAFVAGVLAPPLLLAWTLSARAPRDRKLPGRFDPLGMLLAVATLALLLIGIPGLFVLRNLALGVLLVVGLVLLGLWIWQQRGREAPLLPGDLLARPRFRGALLARLLAAAALSLAELVLIIHVMQGWRLGPGALGVPVSLAGLLVGLAALAAGWLLDRRPGAPLVSLGALLLAAGYTLFAALPPGQAAGLLLLGLLALSVGRGLVEAGLTTRLLRSAPVGRSPAAGALQALVEGVARMAAPILLALAAMLPRLGGGGAVQALVLATILALLAAAAGFLGRVEEEGEQGPEGPDARIFSD
ncbi:MFS transporter [Roseomonas sp. 18066]|uniref:MFS transporter n=1 Tax=Roseomonas sp. 18066 TaxID=2681412 RepID=UPI00135AB909|nr:MFS transporter [Roseomonas sp. 18066]